MRIQSLFKTLIIWLVCFNCFGASENEMKSLIEKYDEVTKYHRVELVDEVFTQNFLEQNGGKEKFISKVKSVPKERKRKGIGLLLQRWSKSKVGKFFSAKVKDADPHASSTEFIIKEENGKLKIDGTISDG